MLTSPSGAPGSFQFAGVYASNSPTVPGRFGDNGVTVPNWPPGAGLFYQVAGWHSSLGFTFNPSWFYAYPAAPFAVSAVGYGVAGGTDLSGRAFPPLPLFGGTGISSGFTFCCIPDPAIDTSSLFEDPFGVTEKGFGFNVYDLVGASMIIEASTNLASGSWGLLQNGTIGLYFSDPQWTNYPARFYRVRSL